jgi:hypothetical protein
MNNESEDQEDTLVAKENESTCKQRTSNVNSSRGSRTQSSLDKNKIDLLQVGRSEVNQYNKIEEASSLSSSQHQQARNNNF